MSISAVSGALGGCIIGSSAIAGHTLNLHTGNFSDKLHPELASYFTSFMLSKAYFPEQTFVDHAVRALVPSIATGFTARLRFQQATAPSLMDVAYTCGIGAIANYFATQFIRPDSGY